jgi:hypothetical protein
MAVLSHSCIPLTSNLRTAGSKGSEQSKKEDEQFEELVSILTNAVRNGKSFAGNLIWDYNYRSLWSSRLRDDKGRLNLYKASPSRVINLLRKDTHWYRRLPKAQKHKIKIMCQKPGGIRRIKDYLDTADGVLISLIFSVPEMFRGTGYDLTDRIANSILCNCIHNYDRFLAKLKKLRKTVKKYALEKREIEIDYNQFRDMSYMVRFLEIFNSICKKSSKEKMFRVAMFCQTRACGLAGPGTVKESTSQFLETVMTPRSFEPSPLLEQCIDAVVTQVTDQPNLGFQPEFKISMSTTACCENPRRKEGKFGFLKGLIDRAGLYVPPLYEGRPGTIGDWVWDKALRLIEDPSNHDELLRVNVAAVRENGKARIITSGSFYKDAFLQPFSHITIHAMKIFPQLSDGLKAGRLGWRFIQRIEATKDDIDDTNWIFKTKCKVYSSDLEKATDRPTREQARRKTLKLLEQSGLSKRILSAVDKYWLGDKRLYVKGKFVGYMVNGVPMGDPLTKTDISLVHPISDMYARLKTNTKALMVGNGDDVAGIIEDESYALAHQEATSQLGYDTSVLDTAVTDDWGTYCEEWYHKPVSPINTCKWGSRLKNSLLLPYLDVPKIRTMIATEKDREDFSSDPRGKVTLLGKDQEYFHSSDPGPYSTIYSIASAFQDVSLATIDSPHPLFLPRQFNGIGKAPPDWEVESWMNILRKSRKWISKYYLYAMDEIVMGDPDIVDLRAAKKESNHFGREALVEFLEIPEDDPIKAHIKIRKDQWSEWPEGVLTKLVTLGYLVTESQVQKYYLFQKRLEGLNQDINCDLFEVVKAKMVDLPDIDIESEDAREVVERFSDMYRDAPFRLGVGREENLYGAGILKLLDAGNPLRVTGSNFPMLDKFRSFTPPENLYAIRGRELFRWFMEALKSWEAGNGFPKPPPQDILEDDPIIIRTISDGGADIHFIVTDDLRLFRQCVNKFEDTWIFRISAIHYLQSNTWRMENDSDRSYDELMTKLINDEYGCRVNVAVHVDKGSVETFLNKYVPSPNETGHYWETNGIPWRKDIHKRNLAIKPRGSFIDRPCPLDPKRDLRFPRSLYDWETHKKLKRSLNDA